MARGPDEAEAGTKARSMVMGGGRSEGGSEAHKWLRWR